jgi:hypothetical protein
MRLALCVWLVYIGGQLSWRGITGSGDTKASTSLAAAKPAIKGGSYQTGNR